MQFQICTNCQNAQNVHIIAFTIMHKCVTEILTYQLYTYILTNWIHTDRQLLRCIHSYTPTINEINTYIHTNQNEIEVQLLVSLPTQQVKYRSIM